jgi:sugar phosphate isomerase/epimerase
MVNRLNGHFKGFGNNEPEHDETEEEQLDRKEAAIELASSMRGQWVIGMSLYIALNVMRSQAENSETTASDIRDIRVLIENLFPLYKNVIEREEDWDE